MTHDNIRDAIQAAALADSYDLANEIAERYGWKDICLRCAIARSTVTYTSKGVDWAVCGPCQVALTPGQFIFSPGGAPDGNVYANWPKLVAAARQAGGVKTVLFDDSHEPIMIPPGTWDMSGCVIRGARPLQLVSFSDGAEIQNPREVRDLRIRCGGQAQRRLIPAATA